MVVMVILMVTVMAMVMTMTMTTKMAMVMMMMVMMMVMIVMIVNYDMFWVAACGLGGLLYGAFRGPAMQASQEPANRSGGQTPENDAPERGELAARRLPDHRWSVRRLRAAPCAARRAATV